MKPVLICGGVGKKMWPLSRRKLPKHFLPLFKGKSLYQLNYEVLLKKFKPNEIFIQTTADQAKTALRQAPGIPRENCFIEPELRDHGPAMGFMAAKLSQIDPDEPFTLVQADVLREPADAYLEMIDQCEILIKKEGKLITGGIRPNFPMMGVDYLKTKKKGKKIGGMKIFEIGNYIDRSIGEKKIEKLFKQKLILVHANHYSWTPRLLLLAFQKLAPDWYRPLKKIVSVFGTSDEEKIIKQEYIKMKKGPIERITQFALADGYVVEVPFKWYDFGTWESFFRYKVEKKQYSPGENFLELDSENCFIKKEDKKFVALLGIKGLFIIDTADGLLICDRSYDGRVGEIVEYLRKKGKKEYL